MIVQIHFELCYLLYNNKTEYGLNGKTCLLDHFFIADSWDAGQQLCGKQQDLEPDSVSEKF